MNIVVSASDLLTALYNEYSMGQGWKRLNVSANYCQYQLPTKGVLELNGYKTDWMKLAHANFSSNRLWSLSLKYLIDLSKINSRLAIDILNSFYQTLWLKYDELQSTLPGSWDHCTAMRIEVLCGLIGSGNDLLASRAFSELENEIAYALEPTHIKRNNHGFMLIESVILASVAFEVYDRNNESLELRRYAEHELAAIFKSVFGLDGYCNENSPFYSHLYVHRMKQMLARIKNFESLSEIGSRLSEQIQVATVTLEAVLHPDGSIPPMGDSSPMETRIYKSSDGVFASTRTGFWAWKNNGKYVSFKCGYESLVHKHADDTSITVRNGSDAFIVDSGFCSFDYSDPRVLMLRTQRAHSGLYFPSFDHLHPAKIYKAPYKKESRLYDEGGNAVSGSYSLFGGYFAYRRVKIQSESYFIVEDWAGSASGDGVVHRFVVPDDVRIEISSSGMTLFGGESSLKCSFSRRMNYEISSGQESSPHKGWISTNPGSVVPARCIELTSQVFTVDPVQFQFQFSSAK